MVHYTYYVTTSAASRQQVSSNGDNDFTIVNACAPGTFLLILLPWWITAQTCLPQPQ